MALEPGPVDLDPYQSIVNVNWGGAIEFNEEPTQVAGQPRVKDDKMYRILNLPNTNKLSIAMWVRVPQKEFDKLEEESDPEHPEDEWITLIEFGLPGPTVPSGQSFTNVPPSYSPTSELLRSRIDVKKDRTRVIFTSPQYTQGTFTCDLVNPTEEIQTASFITVTDSKSANDIYTPMLVFNGDIPADWLRAELIEVRMPSLPAPQNEWLGEYHEIAGIFPGPAVPPLPAVGEWFVHDVAITTGPITTINVPAGTVVEFRVTIRTYTTIPFTDEMQLGIRYSARPYGFQYKFGPGNITGLDNTDDGSNRVAPSKTLGTIASFVPDAWNCILVSVDTSETVQVKAGTVRPTTPPTYVIGYPTYEKLHKLTMIVNNVDWTPKYIFRERTDAGVNSDQPLWEYEATTLDIGNMPPTRFPNALDEASGLGPAYGPGPTQRTVNFPVGFLWRGDPFDNVPYREGDWCNTDYTTEMQNMTVAPWKIALKDNNLGIPSQPQHDTKGRIEYGPVQIWVEKFLDFTDPDIRSKFLNLDTKEIVQPSTTWAEGEDGEPGLGQPDYYFNGGPGSFTKNRGKSDPVFTEDPPSEEELEKRKFTVEGKPKSYNPVPKIAGKVFKDKEEETA
jgi:hypothetical protein